MKKALFFVENNLPIELAGVVAGIRAEGYRVIITNGNVKKGFEDSCDKVYMVKPFEHVVNWCKRSFIEFQVLSGESVNEDKVIDQEPEQEPEFKDIDIDSVDETEARTKYEILFGKKAGNMKLENILAKIEESESGVKSETE